MNTALTVEALTLHMQGMSVLDVSLMLKRSEAWVYQALRAAKYHLPEFNPAKGQKRLWTEDEINYLKDNRNKTTQELATVLKRGYNSVKSKIRHLDLHRDYFCNVCGEQLTQKGNYCTSHEWIGRNIRSYHYSMSHKHPDKQHTLTEEQITELMLSDCAYCGDEGRGIDRIDSGKGYTPENTVACCTMCNQMKLNHDESEWVAQMKKILVNMGECK